MARGAVERLLPGVPAAIARLLEPAAGPLAVPIRSEIFGPQRFAQHGRSLGLTHRAERPLMRRATFFPRLRNNIAVLRQAQAAIADQAAAGYGTSPAAQWLLDNAHLIEAQLLAIHEGLPRSYFRNLPVLLDASLAGLPRIYGVAWAFVAHTDGAFDDDLLVGFMRAYQEARELRLGEIWALPTTLRVVLVENLRRLAERLAANMAARSVADLVCDHIEQWSVERLARVGELLVQRGAATAFYARMAQRLQDRALEAHLAAPDAVLAWLRTRLPNLATVQAQEGLDQTADNLSVSNAVTSLRVIGDADWPAIVARASRLMQRMLAAPSFAAEHMLTRDQTLHAIERLARRSGRSELAVARTLLGLMQGAHARGDPVQASAGAWLRGDGQATLARALGLQADPRLAWRRLRLRLGLPLYLGAVALFSAVLLAWLLPRGGAGWHGPLQGLLLLLALLPASEAAVALVHRLVSESAPPLPLPRLALADGIPAAHRVMVAIPALLVDDATTDQLVHRLHLHWLANPEPQAQFALLSDGRDAATETLAQDAALLAHAVARVGALNAAQDIPREPDAPPRFLVLHRGRRYSHSEQGWIGWDRKRGKVEQLLAELATGVRGAFADLGPVSAIAPGTRYLVALDSDTQLPPGRLRELVGVAAHPENAPQLSADGARVVSGYGILQPRVATPLPAPYEDTWFHRLFSGQPGIDPYSSASSEVFQDLFEEGSFTGKGLLQVQAVHAVLGGRLPPGQVLSHDLLEGALVRCAAVTDIALIEDAPGHAEVAASRVHRWTRGDWQLLPFLLRPGRWPLGAVNRWKLFDNLRRSLLAPASLGLLVLALSGRGGLSPWRSLALVAAAFTVGPLLGALAGLVPSRPAVAKRHFYRQAGREFARALGAGAWQLAMLLQHAAAALDAIARGLWRMAVSQRHLLQWTTAASAQAAARGDFAYALRLHAGVPLAAALLFAGLWGLAAPHAGLALALALLWGAAPLWSWAASRPVGREPAAALSEPDRAYLLGVARDTWRYFERAVGAAELYLPPDNLQTHPHEMLAHRTSPTNIGLYLLSVACAREFGWIGTPELLTRLEQTLDSVDGLERHRGHLLNWYDTASGQALLPMYVSTVDSGNLSGHLLAVAQACLALARAPPQPGDDDSRGDAGNGSGMGDRGSHHDADAVPRRLRRVAYRCERTAWRPDFRFLYHPRRHLLHIGWRVAEQQLDVGFYDLLASESRLTSLLAIAKGDVPVRHWSALGRPFYAVGAAAALRSWSGSMFEYLMPTLVLAEPQGSVLHEACGAALVEQRRYAHAHRVPWGISESAYAGCDHTLAYQYAPQGVPRLALRRTPPDELVVAPYASALAAQIAPVAAVLNLAALQGLGARGALGFIEALDFSPGRQTAGETLTPVLTFMAHHQGMTLVALANVLCDGVAQRWGMANAHLQAVASLLHERAPREVSSLYAPPGPALPVVGPSGEPALLRPLTPGRQAVEPTQLLSNGHYSVALRANGAGTSRSGQVDIHRWRDDALRDAWGQFLYLRRAGGAALVSLTQHPAPDPAARYRAVFHADRVCYTAHWPDLQARITVWVSPEDDIEFRQLELLNLGDEPLAVELVSAFDVSLAQARADEAHPAFGNLFVSAHAQPAQQALRFERRPRLVGEPALMAAHFLVDTQTPLLGLRCQVDRRRWLGRQHEPSAPRARLDDWPAGPDECLLDTGLDPVCALAVRLELMPQRQAELTFATAASGHGPTLQAVIDKYRQPSHVARASLMSATLAGIRLRDLRLAAENLAPLQTLTTALVQSLSRAVSLPQSPAACDKRGLWRYGISGDRPLILVTIATLPGLGLVQVLAQALRWWSWGGVACDLVVVNAEPTSYLMALQRDLGALRDRLDADAPARAGAAPVALHLLRAVDLADEALTTLHAVARIRLSADGRPLAVHLRDWIARHEAARALRQDGTAAVTLAVDGAGEADDAGGAADGAPAPHAGRFAPESAEFAFEVQGPRRPARPWINVLANPDFGSLVSEAGGGSSWAVNSRLNQLTPWSNDAVADPPGEWLLLQDRRTREVWSLTPSASAPAGASYRIAHAPGTSTIGHRHTELEVTLAWCVDAALAVRQLRVRVVNRGAAERSLRLVGIVEWLLGAARGDRRSVHTALHRPGGAGPACVALLATQQEHSAGFGGGTAFWALTGDPAGSAAVDWTCDRRECFDARGRAVLPDVFGRTQGSGGEPCAALSTELVLPPGSAADRLFLLGWAADDAAARALVETAARVPAPERRRLALAHWDRLLGATTVRTPDPLFDALVNRWLLYQTVACRLWARAAFYQAGGATGFRDQLQDAMALAWAEPALLRAQIVLCASRQFAEGDVQHWWHAPQGAGVRTHFCDDLLWLPYALAHYLRATGDGALLEQSVAFLEGAPIPPGAEDRYDTPAVSLQQASVYEHAARAIDHSLAVGVHGLPLMGSGDWNDGMNRVGIGGQGESVWLAWFLCRLVDDFGPVARGRGDDARAERWAAAAQGWRAALQGPAWDGAWYRRAYFDNGQALGASANAEARIDLIAQAWAVLSGVAPPDRQAQALAAVQGELVDASAGLLRLLTPPFVRAEPSPGYIQAYPPGVRENGGQYSHAGVWGLMAQLAWTKAQRGPEATEAGLARAWQWFLHLSPAHRAAQPQQASAYEIEPYVMAGDVYSAAPYVGRGGWSWYTGSAAWMHRAAIESILGLTLGARHLRVDPGLPPHWPRAELALRRDGRVLRFLLLRSPPAAALQAAAPWCAAQRPRLLLPGVPLAWPALEGESCFVVPLLEAGSACVATP
ncbi:MAG: carbohydrate-binding protein [Burkholderiales bacterium]|nr:carbohydrate-binding protein [Burkholderiales bacterium]